MHCADYEKDSSDMMNRGHQDAQSLQKILLSLMEGLHQYSQDAANEHATSLQHVSERAHTEADAIFALLSTAVASSISLQNELVCTFLKV